MSTAAPDTYVGRRRRAPQCQFGLDGCTGDGAEIQIPDEELYSGMDSIGVACPGCESKLYRDS